MTPASPYAFTTFGANKPKAVEEQLKGLIGTYLSENAKFFYERDEIYTSVQHLDRLYREQLKLGELLGDNTIEGGTREALSKRENELQGELVKTANRKQEMKFKIYYDTVINFD